MLPRNQKARCPEDVPVVENQNFTSESFKVLTLETPYINAKGMSTYQTVSPDRHVFLKSV